MTGGLTDLRPPFPAFELKQYYQNTGESLKDRATVILRYVKSHGPFVSGAYLKKSEQA